MGARRLTLRRAVFLDRDGVLNHNVRNPSTGAWEAPQTPAQFHLISGVTRALAELHEAGFLLFLVSNQPDFAKGKSTLATLGAIHRRLEAALIDAGISFTEFNYCFHHPGGVVPAYSGPCRCRKPSAYFLRRAREQFALELRKSWMIGDRSTDIECGLAAGVKTVLVGAVDSQRASIDVLASDYVAADLAAAAKIVLRADSSG
jgi:D-glycero-D-manno-heptose 1,7-bisphosphate phosphatase